MLIDISEYIVPARDLRVDLSSGEICTGEYGTLSNVWQRKNNNDEHFFYNRGEWWRGRDTSHSGTTFYDTFTVAAREIYGHRWLPRVVVVGRRYDESCHTTIRRKPDGAFVKSFMWNSTIEVYAHHASYTFPTGYTIGDVLELRDYTPAGVHFESKFYAREFGLVGWTNNDDLAYWVTWAGIGSYNVGRPTYPPHYVAPADPWPLQADTLTTQVTITPNTAGLNIRCAPSTSAPIVGTFAALFGESIDTTTAAGQSVESGGYWWTPFTTTSLGRKIVLWVATDFIAITPRGTTPEPEPTPDGCITQIREVLTQWFL